MWDWLWNTLVAPWPDFQVGTFEIRDFVNLVVAVVGIYLARLALRIAREQSKLGEKQTAIAEQQYEILQAEIARDTKVSPWAFFDDVPTGSFALTMWAWSVAPMRILSWKLIFRVVDVAEVEVTETATGRRLTVEAYSGPFMPAPPKVVHWQVVSTEPIEIAVGGYSRFAVCRVVRPPGMQRTPLHIDYEVTTKYRKYFGTGKDSISVEFPH